MKKNKEDTISVASKEDQKIIDKFFEENPSLANKPLLPFISGKGIRDGFSEKDSWIQTYSGRRFCPTNPDPESIVIQDIAHALSMQCRFSGHTKDFYSVAQHSVGVSYLCNEEDALWGLLHDASEAYLVDIPSPLKTSGEFNPYLKFEKNMMEAVCKRFKLSLEEPKSVKRADKIMLGLEANKLMSPLRDDWNYKFESAPFNFEPLQPRDAKNLFLRRFFELQGCVLNDGNIEHFINSVL